MSLIGVTFEFRESNTFDYSSWRAYLTAGTL
jgi:hypothetical protein